MPKHIVFDARESGSTTGRYMDKLVEYLHRENPPYDITLLAKPARAAYLQQLAPNFSVVETDVKEFTFAEQTTLLRQIKALRPDLVHFPIVQQPVFYRGTVVTTMHDLTTVRFRNPAKHAVVFWVKQQVYKWVNRRVAEKSAALLANSEYTKQDVAAYCHVPLEKITVTHLSADPVADTVEAFAPMQDKRFIMYVGRPQPHKNLDRLLDAFEKLLETQPDLHLVLAGKKDALYERYASAVDARGLKQVVFTDFIEDAQLRWLYENCQAYVFPSLSEGFGLPGLEAMLHGAPVVSSNATCLPEVYGDAAHYFDPLDVDDMVRAISDVLTDEKLHADLVARGHEQVKKYSWQRMAQQTLTVYNQILNQ